MCFPCIIIIIDVGTECGVEQKELKNFRSQLGEEHKLPQINISSLENPCQVFDFAKPLVIRARVLLISDPKVQRNILILIWL